MKVITELLALGEKKSWLRESCWWSILLALGSLRKSSVDWKDEALSGSVTSIFVEYKAWTPEKVAIAVKLPLWYPNHDWTTSLSPSFKSGDVLSTSSLSNLVALLKVREHHIFTPIF